eukprot:12221100-Heterocapsa_arctica.AAC.1
MGRLKFSTASRYGVISNRDMAFLKPYFQSNRFSSDPSNCSGHARPLRSTMNAAVIAGMPDADADDSVSGGSTTAAIIRSPCEPAMP